MVNTAFEIRTGQLRRRALLGAVCMGPWGAALSVEKAATRLTIAYNDDYAPYSFVEDGELKGILPDALESLLMLAPGIKVARVGMPWRRVQLEVKTDQQDALCTFASEERLQYALAHKIPVVTLKPHLFFSAANPARKTIEKITRRDELKEFGIVDLKGNQWAEQNLAGLPKVEYVPVHNDVFNMIMGGHGDIHVSLSPLVTQWRIKKLGIAPDKILSVPAPYVAADVPFHLLIRKTYPHAQDILNYLDDALRRPTSKKIIDDVMRRYI